MSTPELPGWLTLAEAAALVGLSRRTLKRRIAAGELSATLRPWGARERWEVQGAELARWAAASGRPLTVTMGAGDPETEGHGAASVTPPPAEVAASLAAEVDKLRAELAAVKEDRDAWRQAANLALRALPAAREAAREVCDPWWRRLFGGRRAGREEGGPGA